MRRIAVLCGLAVVLSLILTWELAAPAPDANLPPRRETASPESASHPTPSSLPESSSRSSSRPMPSSGTAMSEPGARPGSGLDKAPPGAFEAEALLDMTASISGRPLFNPARRPPPGKPAVPSGSAPADALPRLTGVIVGPAGGRAIFAGGSGKSRTAAAGDNIGGGFRIRSIEPGRVTLLGPEGPRVLRPAYGTSPRTDARKDAAADVQRDAQRDAGADAGTDGGTDGGANARADGRANGGTETGVPIRGGRQ